MSLVDIDPENLADEENFSGLMPFLADAVKKRIVEDDVDGLRIIENEARNLAKQLIIFADTIEVRKREYKRIKNKMRDLEEQARLQQETIATLKTNMLAEFGISVDDTPTDPSSVDTVDIPGNFDVETDSDLGTTPELGFDSMGNDLLSYGDGKDLSVFNFDPDDDEDDLLADLGFGYAGNVSDETQGSEVLDNTGYAGVTDDSTAVGVTGEPGLEDDFDLIGFSNVSPMVNTSTPGAASQSVNQSSNVGDTSGGFDLYNFGNNQSSGSGSGSSPFSDGSDGDGALTPTATNSVSETNPGTISFEEINPFAPSLMFSDDDYDENEYSDMDNIADIYAEDDEYKKQLEREKKILSQKRRNRNYSDEQMSAGLNSIDVDDDDDLLDGEDDELNMFNAPLVQRTSLVGVEGINPQMPNIINSNGGTDTEDNNVDEYEDISDENFFAI